MGFLSKLFGGSKDAEKTALDLLKNLMNSDKKEDRKEEKKQEEAPAPAQDPSPVYDSTDSGPSGFSWGERMPAEENQYNYNGTYREYFEHIFRDDFSQYQLKAEPQPGGKRIVYTLFDLGRTVCVVEVMHQGSDSKKLREKCRRNGIGYCRFYHNHDGWWNTREYVVTRIKEAIG